MGYSIIVGLNSLSEKSIYIFEMSDVQDGVNLNQNVLNQDVGNYQILPSERAVLLRLIRRIKARDKQTWVSERE